MASIVFPLLLFLLTFSPIITKSSESFLSSSMSITSWKMAYKRSTIKSLLCVRKEKHKLLENNSGTIWLMASIVFPLLHFLLTFSPIITKSSESFLSSSMSITSRKMAYKSTIQWFMLFGQKHVVNKQKPNINWKRHNKSKTLNNNWVVGELCNAYPFPLFDQLNWGWRINLYVATDSLRFRIGE